MYRFAADGTPRGRLTEGEWEVEKVVAVDEARGVVWFLADRSSTLQTHLYRVPIAGGDVVQVTQGRGTHDVTMAPGNERFLSEWSSAVDPPRILVVDAEGRTVRTPTPPRLEVLQPYALPA